MSTNHVPKGNKPIQGGIPLSKCWFSLSPGLGWRTRCREGTKMSVSVTEEVGEIFLSCQPTCVSQGEAEGTQGRWWVGSWMVCWVKYSRSVRVKLFKAWHTCLGAIQAFLLWQRGATEGFPWCHCCFEKVSSRSVLGSEWAVGRLWHGERLLPVLLLVEPPLANPSSMWLQLTAIKMCWPKRFNINQSYSRSQFRGFKKERKKKSDANREIEVNIWNVSHGLEIEK